MLRREIITKIKEHLTGDKKNALLIDGARQVGKTYIIRAILNEISADYVEINFIENKNAKELFSKENIDGGLVGGASLKAEFIDIVNYDM